MKAGFKAPVSKDIRGEIWVKLWGNLSFNPISALTHATLEDICRFPATRALAATMMAEAQTVAEKLGVEFKISLDKRIAGAEAIGAHKTSMLQDVEAGRALELEALVGCGGRTGPHHRHADADHRGDLRRRPACSARRWRSRAGGWRSSAELGAARARAGFARCATPCGRNPSLAFPLRGMQQPGH